MTAFFTLLPANYDYAGPGSKDGREVPLPKFQYEEHNTDPRTLSDGYLAEVAQRKKNGTASQQDYLYQIEIARRKREGGGLLGTQDENVKSTFAKLKDKEIRALQDIFGDGDPKFIEKLKTGSGSGAGKLDLYQEDQTGDIILNLKGSQNCLVKKAEYNIYQLK